MRETGARSTSWVAAKLGLCAGIVLIAGCVGAALVEPPAASLACALVGFVGFLRLSVLSLRALEPEWDRIASGVRPRPVPLSDRLGQSSDESTGSAMRR